jgi:hypothetical protein
VALAVGVRVGGTGVLVDVVVGLSLGCAFSNVPVEAACAVFSVSVSTAEAPSCVMGVSVGGGVLLGSGVSLGVGVSDGNDVSVGVRLGLGVLLGAIAELRS